MKSHKTDAKCLIYFKTCDALQNSNCNSLEQNPCIVNIRGEQVKDCNNKQPIHR